MTTTIEETATAIAPETAKAPRSRKPAAKQQPASQAAKPKVVSKMIPIGKIEADPDQPRKFFDPDALRELSESMKALGQVQPIAVRHRGDDSPYRIMVGERRWRAAQMAGLKEMRCLVHYGIPDGDRETLAKQIAENVGRSDMTPMEEAEGFNNLIEAGYAIEEVAKMCGKSESYVGWRIDLLKLAPALQDAVAKGHLPVGLSWYAAQLAHDNQVRFLSRWARGDFPTKRDAEAFAQACAAEEKRQSDQGAMFVLAEIDEAAEAADDGREALFADLSVDERERVAAERRKLLGKIERLSEIGTVLAEIATMEPGELALLLAGAPGGLAAQRQRLDHLKDLTMKANKTLREAQAVASVRSAATQAAPGSHTDATADADSA